MPESGDGTVLGGETQPPHVQGGGQTLLELPSGKGMNGGEANAITRRSFTSVILFAGTAASGKTTLLSTLHLLFQKGPFAGYVFAGSQTLVGFESRLYYSRTASKREKPTTERTKVSEYLHLRVRPQNLSQSSRDLLLCDLSGEDFREAKDSSEACRRLRIIERADRFVLLVDGEKLSRPDSRQRARNDPATLLRNCLDTGMLDSLSAVDVIFTKWDIVESSSDKDTIVKFANSIESDFRNQFEAQLRELRVARIAAHPSEADLPLGYGLEGVFSTWAGAVWDNKTVLRSPRADPQSLSEYDRYLGRRFSVTV